jgi:multidrug resistance efflux pump
LTTLDRAQRNADTAEQSVAAAKAAEQKPKLAYQSTIGDENTTVAQMRQQLEQAKYNLAEATVRAPCEGFVTNLQLAPGAIVSAAARSCRLFATATNATAV